VISLKKENGFSLVIIGTAQFILLTFIAMLFYPGGTRIDSTTLGYGFFTNFFSDLGRTVAYSNKGNLVSATIFIIAVIGLGVTFLGYFSLVPKFFHQTEEEKRISTLVKRIGYGSALAFIGVAFTPTNLVSLIHDFFVVTGFTLVTVVLSLILYLTWNDPRFSKGYVTLYLFLIILILAYGGLFFLIPKIITLEHLIIRVTIQKLVIYTLLTCFLIQSYSTWRVFIRNS
jgi:hypothetical protein